MEYLFTERAHLMCPGMCFGIVLFCKAGFNEERISDTVLSLAKAHPFLKAKLGFQPETNSYFYEITDRSVTELRIYDDELSSADHESILREFERLTMQECNLFREGMLKISVWKSGEETCILMVFHHLLADGRGALMLAREFSDYCVYGIAPSHAEEHLMTEADFPPGSELPLISRLLVDRANRGWEKEAHAPLSYEQYRYGADQWRKDHPVRYSLTKLDPEELSSMRRQCHDHGVTVNDVLLAKMMVEENTDKIIIARDLRDQLSSFVKGSLGNYSTAFSVELSGKKNRKDLFPLAEQIHQKVQKIIASPSQLYLVLQCYARLNPSLLDAAFLSAVNGFESKAASFIGKRFFGFDSAQGYSITNLGRMENQGILQAWFIPPASPAIRTTLGVLTVNGTMTICRTERI